MRKRLGSQLASADVHNYRILLNMRYAFFRSGGRFKGYFQGTMILGVYSVQRVLGFVGFREFRVQS